MITTSTLGDSVAYNEISLTSLRYSLRFESIRRAATTKPHYTSLWMVNASFLRWGNEWTQIAWNEPGSTLQTQLTIKKNTSKGQEEK